MEKHTNRNTIMIPDTRGVSVIDIDSIIRIEARSNYSKIYLSCGKTILLAKVLKQMEEMLAGKGFTRIHRSHLVNTSCIEAYILHQQKIMLHNKEQICISRRRGSHIKKELSEQKAGY